MRRFELNRRGRTALLKSVDRAQGADDDVAAESTTLQRRSDLSAGAAVDRAASVHAFEQSARGCHGFVLFARGECLSGVENGVGLNPASAQVSDDPHPAVMRAAVARGHRLSQRRVVDVPEFAAALYRMI